MLKKRKKAAKPDTIKEDELLPSPTKLVVSDAMETKKTDQVKQPSGVPSGVPSASKMVPGLFKIFSSNFHQIKWKLNLSLIHI